MTQTPNATYAQYVEIKGRYDSSILLFRAGDFYETFNNDAVIVAETLDLVLTARTISENNTIPTSGIPYDTADGYIAKLTRAGHKVVVCEQISGPTEVVEPVSDLVPAVDAVENEVVETEAAPLFTPSQIRRNRTAIADAVAAFGDGGSAEDIADELASKYKWGERRDAFHAEIMAALSAVNESRIGAPAAGTDQADITSDDIIINRSDAEYAAKQADALASRVEHLDYITSVSTPDASDMRMMAKLAADIREFISYTSEVLSAGRESIYA